MEKAEVAVNTWVAVVPSMVGFVGVGGRRGWMSADHFGEIAA